MRNLKRSWIVAITAALLCAGLFYWHSRNALEVPSRADLAKAFPTGANKILESASEVTLYSLWSKAEEDSDLSPQGFHGKRVLGKITLKGEAKKQLIAHFYDAIAEPASPGACFDPHHGIRIKQKGKTVDFLICFSCHQFITYGLGPEKEPVQIGERGKKYFNSVLTNAGIELQNPQ